MHDVVMAHAAANHIFVAVAAVADWRIAEVSERKIKKSDDADPPQFHLQRNPDILAAVAALAKGGQGPFCVGFAAESEDLALHGEEKRKRKNIPLLVGNIGPSTFGKDDNELMLFDESGSIALPRAEKKLLARMLIAEIARRLPAGG